MKSIILGKNAAPYCLIQAVDEQDAALLQKEHDLIKKYTGKEILLAAFQVGDWNKDLSPWEAEPVFGEEPFGKDAKKTLSYIAENLIPSLKENGLAVEETKFIIGGYSLAALFSLWVVYQTDFFFGCAAASPSVWFPDWISYAEKNKIKTKHVYLSLGDKEEKTKNPVMKTVADCIRRQEELLQADPDVSCVLEWNKGNHFKEPEVRTAKGFAEIINRNV